MRVLVDTCLKLSASSELDSASWRMALLISQYATNQRLEQKVDLVLTVRVCRC
jgi:hypothetical protein